MRSTDSDNLVQRQKIHWNQSKPYSRQRNALIYTFSSPPAGLKIRNLKCTTYQKADNWWVRVFMYILINMRNKAKNTLACTVYCIVLRRYYLLPTRAWINMQLKFLALSFPACRRRPAYYFYRRRGFGNSMNNNYYC